MSDTEYTEIKIAKQHISHESYANCSYCKMV